MIAFGYEKDEAGDHYHYRDFNKKWTSEESDFIIFLEEDVESSR